MEHEGTRAYVHEKQGLAETWNGDIWRDRDLRARPNVSLLNVPLVIWVRFALRLAGDEHPCSETVKK